MIFVEDQLVKIDGVVLPGLLKKIEITSSAKIDEQEVEGSATKPKQATGYEDGKIIVELILDDTPSKTKYQALETIRAVFRKPGQTVPQPIAIVSEDTAKHGIDKVLFKSMRHVSESKKDQLDVSLEFWEYIPQTIKASKAGGSSGSSASSGGSKSSGSSASSGSSSASSGLSESYTSYLSEGRGKSPVARDMISGVAAGAVSMIAKVLPNQ